ncbi:carbon-nitrogen hydrolase [Vulcanimicrobium alpinum]|uniref:Carbon-nitrogen hydrolase n=1 Tax=Vulcanimicrobium alpinum TaxID=3016050 RepID=A0AAN2C9S1_UNVUL|nr:nitrilase-related carbon-nitrogen hydrolase [Vulcanimicrobium alpinum]BDE06326.1 carbon-nitrogen hydrolase [Vulcanimicrobium alpinum]
MHAALVQFKPRKGEVAANLAAMRAVFAQLAERPIDLIVFPEAALTGYFLEGAVYELAFESATLAAKIDEQWRASGAGGAVDVVCGFYENFGGTFHNSAIYVRCGEPDGVHVVHVHRKMFLPTYGVFDEERFLTRGRHLSTFPTPFGEAAMLICEDMWHALMPTVAALKGARLLIVPSASPARGLGGDGELESTLRWKAILGSTAAEHGVYVLYAGLTGFEGGKGMGGATCAFSPRGDLIASLGPLDAGILRVELDTGEIDIARATIPLLGDLSAVLPDLWLDEEIPVTRRVEERA